MGVAAVGIVAALVALAVIGLGRSPVGLGSDVVPVLTSPAAGVSTNVTFVSGKTFADIPLEAGLVTVVPKRTGDLPRIAEIVAARGGRVIGPCGTRACPNLRIDATLETLRALEDAECVAWLENLKRKHLFNRLSSETIGVACVRREEVLGLTGAGELITTCDSGIDTGDRTTMHPDFAEALVGFATVDEYEDVFIFTRPNDICGHGTHTAGSLVGSGVMSDGDYRGMAPGAKLWAWFSDAYETDSRGRIIDEDFLMTPSLVDDAFRPEGEASYAACGMTAFIHSASYGSQGVRDFALYNADAVAVDTYCWNHPDFLPVFAASNEGAYGDVTLGYEATSKNALVVGSSRGGDAAIADFSSRGPTRDGRSKPDVVAPGTDVWSCRSQLLSGSGWYRSDSGTSMSAPIAAGACALVREWLVRHRSVAFPTSALVKAVVRGGADDLGFPAKDQGAGRINVRQAIVEEDGLSVFLCDRIPFAAGESLTFEVTTTNAAPLVAELVWVDYPGVCSADKAARQLVNDLDLVVSTPGAVARGNMGPSFDRINNTEGVRLASVPAGVCRVTVDCHDVPHPSTEGGAAALYLKGAFDRRAVRTLRASVTPKVLFR